MKLKELSKEQLQHMAWRLDCKTACGLITASRICRLETEHNDEEVWKIFSWFTVSERSAKIQARKVINYST